MATKKVIGFTVSRPESNGYGSEYRALHIRFSHYFCNDAAKRVASAVKEGCMVDSAVRDAKALREETGGTEYFTSAEYDQQVTFKWQDDSERRDSWYGCHCEMHQPCDASIELLRQIRKVYEHSMGCHNTLPRELVEKLLAAGAVPLKSVDGLYDGWARDKDFSLDTAIPAPATKEAETTSV